MHETVVITANGSQVDLPADYAGGQVARGGRLGLFGNMDMMNIPFDSTNYTAQYIRDQQANSVADIVQGDPAVRPVIVPVFFWEAAGPVPSYGPPPGQTAMIASNCERLDVFIGGRLVASAQPATGSPLYRGLLHPPFLVRLPRRLPNPAPDLLIQGIVGGRPVTQVRMSARPAGDALAMAVDDATISADGSDATRVAFRAIDAFGNQRRYGSGQVALTLSGPAVLLGDNPFEFGQYGGLGAVWIRSLAGQPGPITLTASHPLLGQAEVQVRSLPVKHSSELT